MPPQGAGPRKPDLRLVKVPAKLDACVTAIRPVKQGKQYPEIAGVVRQEHGVALPQFDA